MLLPAVLGWPGMVPRPSRRCSGRLGSDFPREAFTGAAPRSSPSGSRSPRTCPRRPLSFVAATVGLVLVALLIAFLPSIYSQFSRREILVGQLDTRAGTPPDPAVLLAPAVPGSTGWRELDDLWTDWDRWFVGAGGDAHVQRGAAPSSAASTRSGRG